MYIKSIETNNAPEGKTMNSNTAAASTPLLLLGVIQLVAIKVPDGVSVFAFYGSAALAAVIFLAIVAACVYSEKTRYAAGLLFVLAVLAMAVFIVLDMPPYIAPSA